MFLRKLLALIGACVVPATLAVGKEVPPSYYPKEYDLLAEPDWPAMKTTFEAIVATKGAKRIDDALVGKAIYTIARIARIHWSDGRREEVADYLMAFAGQLLRQDGKAAVEPAPLAPDARKKIILRAIWCYGELAVPLERDKFTDIWSLSLDKVAVWRQEIRMALLIVLDGRFSDPAVPAIATAILKAGDKRLEKREIDMIDRVLLKCKLATIKDQSEAWGFLWSATKPADPLCLH